MFDDNPIILEGLLSLFKQDEQFSMVFQCTSPEEIHQNVEHHEPDVMIMDVLSEGISGVEAYRKVRMAFPDVLLVSFTNVSSVSVIKSLYAAGANAYLHKSAPPVKLCEIIRYIIETGRLYIPDDFPVRAQILKNLPPLHLTKTEKNIIRLIILGMTTKEIALAIFVSENTVEFHRKNLMRKFEVHNMAALVREAIAFGYDKD